MRFAANAKSWNRAVVATRLQPESGTRARETSAPRNFRQRVNAEPGPGAGNPAGHRRRKRAAVDCSVGQGVGAAPREMGNPVTASGRRPRLRTGRNSSDTRHRHSRLGTSAKARFDGYAETAYMPIRLIPARLQEAV